MTDRAKVLARLDEILARPQQGAGHPEACDDHGPDARCMTCITDEEWERGALSEPPAASQDATDDPMRRSA